jgi:hypothetical protein
VGPCQSSSSRRERRFRPQSIIPGERGKAADAGRLAVLALLMMMPALVAAGCGTNQSSGTRARSLQGAGATFPSRVPADLRLSLVDSPVKGAYPIATWTFIIASTRQSDASKGKALVDTHRFMTHQGQSAAAPLGYAPLPLDAVTKVDQKIRSITGPDGKALDTGGA